MARRSCISRYGSMVSTATRSLISYAGPVNRDTSISFLPRTRAAFGPGGP